MNGYVTVVFSNDKYATKYTYMVPDNIKMQDIQRYVVVENSFYDARKNVSPYTVAKVVNWYSEAACPSGTKATKYIVDTIDGETYKSNRQLAIYRKNAADSMDNYFNNLSLENKAAILMVALTPEEMDKIVH